MPKMRNKIRFKGKVFFTSEQIAQFLTPHPDASFPRFPKSRKEFDKFLRCPQGRVNTWKECVTNLDYQIEMIILVSILTTFKARFIFSGSWGRSENWLEP